MLKAKEEVKRMLASDQSSWNADRSILQLNIDATRDEVGKLEEYQAEDLQ